jgi:8-amino-7-oxononanoate synthase
MRKTLSARLAALGHDGLIRRTVAIGSSPGPVVTISGRDVINLSSNDYLGLAAHPALRRAANEASRELGTGAGAARLVTGTLEAHEDLERSIASFVGAPRALLFGSGYLANVGVLASLSSEGGVIFSDERNHASIVDACRLADASVRIYQHRDVSHLSRLLAKTSSKKGPRIIVTESVFSMDGHLGPVQEICDLAGRAQAWVYVDEAHAFGLLGPSGRGLAADLLAQGRVHAVMGTLGKALGSYGAFVAGSAELVEYLTSTARTFLYSTALPPHVVAASAASLGIVSGAEGDALREKLQHNTSFFRGGLEAQGWELGEARGPILPIGVEGARRAVALADSLLSRGVLVRAMRFPTVSRGSERLRIVISAGHDEDHLRAALGAFAEARREGP